MSPSEHSGYHSPPAHSSEYKRLKSSCRTHCEKSFPFPIYPWSTLCPQSNKSQAVLLLPSLIKFSRWNLLKFLRRKRCMRLHSVWTALCECSGQMCVRSKGPAMEPSVFQQDVRCHQVPWELRLISWQRILMWHLAAEKYHLGNGRGAVLWPGIIHSATGWQTGLAASPVFRDTLCFTDKNLTLCSVPHYVSHLSAWV